MSKAGAWANLLSVFLLASCNRPQTLDESRLRGAAQHTANWLMYGRTNDDHRFSPLNQINEQTVAKLGLAWSRELGTTRGLEATPLVEDGVLYTTGSSSVVDRWTQRPETFAGPYDPKVPRERAYFICCDVVNRGVALYRGKVYLGTLDGLLIALEQPSGTPVWSIAASDSAKPYSITSVPRIARAS